MTRIWVDADACPDQIKDVIIRAAVRTKTATFFVANKPIRIPVIPGANVASLVQSVKVDQGPDVADAHIAAHVEAGDIVITSDIPLADATIKKQATVLDSRGQVLTEQNIAERVSMRNMLSEMRDMGLARGGPAPFDAKAKHRFAAEIDRLLAKGAK